MASVKKFAIYALRVVGVFCSSSEHQQRRMMRANVSDITIKEIDKENRFGIFVGDRTYRTTLESCTCPDLKERKLPCKHMYRLASEHGLI